MSKLLIIVFSLILVCFSIKALSTNPSPEQFYVINGPKESSCIALELLATITVTTKENKKVTGYINSTMFNNQSIGVNGTCGFQNQSMSVHWPAVSNSDDKWLLSFVVRNNSNKSYQITELKLHIENYTLDIEGSLLDTVPMNEQYFCKNGITVLLKDSPKGASASMDITNLDFMAYRTPQKNMFYGPKILCPKDIVHNNIVPLVVGGVLAAMVVVVIITYLIGRRRHRGNYQTI